MNFTLLSTELASLDELDQDTLVLHHFLEDRPLAGLAGLVDWRMNGRLARQVLRSWASGRTRDKLMMPGGKHLGVKRILMIGLGSRRDFTPDLFRIVALHTLHSLLKLNVDRFALDLPGMDALKIAPRQAVEIWLTAFHQTFVAPGRRNTEVCLLVNENVVEDVVDPVKIFERKYDDALPA